MTIGEKIKLERQKLGLTQKELGEKCGIASSAIGRYERDVVVPGIASVWKIAEALNLPSAYLLNDDLDVHESETFELYGIQEEGFDAFLRLIYHDLNVTEIIFDDSESIKLYSFTTREGHIVHIPDDYMNSVKESVMKMVDPLFDSFAYNVNVEDYIKHEVEKHGIISNVHGNQLSGIIPLEVFQSTSKDDSK